MAVSTSTSTSLERVAAKIAKNPKAIAQAARSFVALRAGNSVNAFQALREVKEQRAKAKKQYD